MLEKGNVLVRIFLPSLAQSGLTASCLVLSVSSGCGPCVGSCCCNIVLFAGLYGLPKRNGKLKDISHFDAAFFGVHPKQANSMDPQLRLMLEIAYEAIVDGGESKRVVS